MDWKWNNDLMINIKIRYNFKDTYIVLDSKTIQIIVFLLLIVIIIILGVVVVPNLLNNYKKRYKFQRKLIKEASFDNDDKIFDDNSTRDVDNIDNRLQNINSTTTPNFRIRTNLNISPTECNGEEDENNIMEVCSVNSNVSCESNMGDCELNIDNNNNNNHKSIKFFIDSSNVIEVSNNYPDVLIGWKVHVQNYGIGVITDIIKRKMRTTKFRIEFDVPVIVPGSPYKKSNFDLILHRSDKKKGIPFSAIKKVV